MAARFVKHFALFVFDLGDAHSLRCVAEDIPAIRKEAWNKDHIEILVGHKSDLPQQYSDQELTELNQFPKTPTLDSEHRYYGMYVGQAEGNQLPRELFCLIASFVQPDLTEAKEKTVCRAVFK
jgi:hypothetical protein